MSLLVRALLIWSLVLALPAQGFAAATMAFCGPNHHGGGTAAQMQAAVSADHAQHGGTATDHGHPAATVVADEEVSAAASTPKASETSKHQCSACASCCSVGAIMSSVLAVPAPVFTPTVFSAVVPSVDTFAADGPDRPPRLVVA